MTSEWTKCLVEPRLELTDGSQAQPGEQEAEQRSCMAAAEFVRHTHEQDRILRVKAHQKAADILMAAKRSMQPASSSDTSSSWHAEVPGPGSDALCDKVKANLDQLCEGTGIKVIAYYDSATSHYDYGTRAGCML